MKAYNYILLLIVLGACFCFSSPMTIEARSEARENEILAIGSARIIDGNISRARNEALQDAMLKGIESYLVSLLGRLGMLTHFTQIVQDIIPQASGQIGNYHILFQERMGAVYKVFISLRINEALMSQKLKELNILVLKETPVKILFLVSEYFSATGEERYWWAKPEAGLELTSVELALVRIFQEAGFHPVNRLMGLAEGGYESLIMTPALTMDKALQWGDLFAADIVIHGRFIFRPEEVIEVDLKVINVHQAELISHLQYLPPPDDKEDRLNSRLNLIDRTARHVLNNLGTPIIHSMDKPRTQLAGLQVELNGLNNFKQQNFFLDFVQTQVRGVQAVVPRIIKNRSISFLVDYEGDALSFKKSLSGSSGLPFPVDIQILNDGQIRIVIL